MVLQTSYDSHEDTLKRQLSENRKFGSSDVPYKFKRRKVPAVRTFPEAFKQFITHIDWEANEALVSVGTVGNLLGKEVGAGDSEDGSFEPFEVDVGSEENLVYTEMHDLYSDLETEPVEPMVTSDREEALQLGVKLPKALENAEFIDQVETFGQGITDFTESMGNTSKLELKNVLEDGAHTQHVDRPSSLKMSPTTLPKYIFPRRKMSAVRDFPEAFVQFAAQINRRPNKALVSGGTVEKLSGNKGIANDSDDDFESFKTHLGSQGNLLHTGVHLLSYDLESERLEPAVAPDQKEALQLGVDLPKSLDDAESIDQLIDSTVSAGRLKQKNVLEDGAHTQRMDRPGSSKMWPDTSPKFSLPRRRVSGIRCFPRGCGRNATPLGKEDCAKALASYKNKDLSHKKSTVEPDPVEQAIWSKAKQPTQETQDEDAKSKGIFSKDNGDKVQPKSKADATKAMKMEIQLANSSWIKLERVDIKEKCVKPSHRSNLYQSGIKSETLVKTGDRDIGGSERNLTKEFTNEKKDKNKMLPGVSANMNHLQGQRLLGLEVPAHRVIVQALMAAPRCPWRQSKRGFKSKPK